MAAVASPITVPLTVIIATTACGLNLVDGTILATQIFMDDFKTWKDISNEDIDDALKMFSILTITLGKIPLL